MKLILIRHGEHSGDTFACPPSPVSGFLSADGVFQAETLRSALKQFNITHAFTSPYGRAVQTAEIVLRDRGMVPRRLDFLREWLPNPELDRKKFDKALQRAHKLPAEMLWKTELGEGRFEMCERVIPPFLAELDGMGIHPRSGGFVLEEEAASYAVAIFAHGGTLALLLEFLMEMRVCALHRFIFQVAAPAILEFHDHNGIAYPQLLVPNVEYFMP